MRNHNLSLWFHEMGWISRFHSLTSLTTVGSAWNLAIAILESDGTGTTSYKYYLNDSISYWSYYTWLLYTLHRHFNSEKKGLMVMINENLC